MSLGRVLVVDDEPEVAALLREALVECGYLVKIAVTGAEALGLMPVFQPEVVLLDIAMPGLSGVEVLEQLRQRFPRVPVIMVTANTDEAAARRTLKRGAFDYLPKPVDLAVLERTVGAALAARSGPSR
jgi:DNA-binding response OmpR family regulator